VRLSTAEASAKEVAVQNSFLSHNRLIPNGSGAFNANPPNNFQGIIVDETHRLNEKFGFFSNLGENPIKEFSDPSVFPVMERRRMRKTSSAMFTNGMNRLRNYS
jgi:hypothetical protein